MIARLVISPPGSAIEFQSCLCIACTTNVCLEFPLHFPDIYTSHNLLKVFIRGSYVVRATQTTAVILHCTATYKDTRHSHLPSVDKLMAGGTSFHLLPKEISRVEGPAVCESLTVWLARAHGPTQSAPAHLFMCL